MSEHADAKGRRSRRSFLVGLVTGAGVTSALGIAAATGAGDQKLARPVPTEPGDPGPILYRRTAEAERYYRTLYYS